MTAQSSETTKKETTTEIANRYREDSRVMMQALAESADANSMRNPLPVTGRIQPFSQQQVENCLADAILKRIAWSLPSSSTQKMWQLSLGDDFSSKVGSKLVRDYYAYHEKLKTRSQFRKALQFSRSHGGTVIILKINDGRHYSEPVNEGKIKSISGLIVRHRWQVAPSVRTAASIFDLDDIEHYEILTIDQQIKQKLLFNETNSKQDDRLIHRSRILRFNGALMPDDWMISYNNGWGLSVFDEVWKYYKNYTNGLNAVGELIKTQSVLQHSFEGLRELMMASDEESIAAIKQTMKSIRLMFDLYGMVLHDSREQFNWNARPLAGMDSLVQVQKDGVTGASGMPHTIVWGESPGGLGRDGKETQINYANSVAEYQGENLDPSAAILDRYIFLAKDGPTKGKIPDDYQRQYPSILRMTIEDLRSGRLSDIQALASGIQAGFITPNEARTVPSNSDWWPEFNIDQKAWEEARKKAEEQANSLGGFDLGALGGEEAAPPTEEPAPVEEEPITQMDSAAYTPIKRVLNWHGLSIGVTHDKGDLRYNKTMKAGYGHIRRSYGHAEDAKAIDVYIKNPNSPSLWKVRQLNTATGEIDETKYFLGFDSPKEVRDCYYYHAGLDRFGGVEKCDPTELNQYRQDVEDSEEVDEVYQGKILTDIANRINVQAQLD